MAIHRKAKSLKYAKSSSAGQSKMELEPSGYCLVFHHYIKSTVLPLLLDEPLKLLNKEEDSQIIRFIRITVERDT